MDLKRSIQGFVGFYNPCCSNMRRWCSVGTMRMGYKLDHLLRQNGNWKKPSTTSTTNSKIPKLPKFMKSPFKKKKLSKNTRYTTKKQRSPVTVLLDFFVHLPQLGVIPNTPAPRLEGTTCRKVDVTGGEGSAGCFQTLIFWNPKNEKLSVLPGKIKKTVLMNFDSKSQNIKKKNMVVPMNKWI